MERGREGRVRKGRIGREGRRLRLALKRGVEEEREGEG